MGSNSGLTGESPQPLDAAIASLAARQHGNVRREQLIALGCNDEAIAHRVRTGRLHRVHRGVYAVGRPPITPLEHAAAAVLACGPGAALTHASALALWDLGRWPRRHHVTVTKGDPRPKGIIVHRSRALHRRDLTTQRGIRVTSPARTLLDNAPSLTNAQLPRAVNDARRAGLCRPAALSDVLARNPTHPGAKRLQPFADTSSPLTASTFEDRFVALCRNHDLPTPQCNAIVCGYEVDALFAAEKLIVELDSWEFHRDRASFVNDRNRDADTLAAGYATVRITWERRDDTEAKRLARILAARQ